MKSLSKRRRLACDCQKRDAREHIQEELLLMHGLGDKLEEKREPRGRELRKSISAVFFLCYRRGLAGEAPPKVGPWYRAGLQLPVVAGAPGPVPGGEQKQGAFSPLPSACWCSDSVSTSNCLCYHRCAHLCILPASMRDDLCVFLP